MVAALALACAGCLPVYANRWVELPLDQALVAEHSDDHLKVGDHVFVRTLEGKRHEFMVTKVEPTAFFGTASDHASYRVPFKLLASIEARRPAWGLEPMDAPIGGNTPVALPVGGFPARF